MGTYITLLNFTEQGARTIKDTVKRYEIAAKAGQEYGVKFKTVHWTLGQYDLVCEIEAKDEAGLAAFTLAMASQGNVRFQTLRAFSADEMKGFIAKMPG
ncbi:MAG: GYD domain-containing protein [Burkholderiaceae bacterium]|nr:GYD domain-containing protein [Roseateles sp.]MBV8471450.1 GYD domain-containing protein [Burkholderiaceae bacterium]